MPRALSNAAIQAAQASETDVVFLQLVTINHPSLASPIYVCDNNEPFVSRGNTYLPVAFTTTLPDDSSEALPSASITMDNVAQELIDTVRSITSPASFVIEVVTTDSPDYVELIVNHLLMKNVSWDDLKITAELSGDDVLNQSWPDSAFTPNEYPGLFA